MTARRDLLDGLARDADLFEVLSGLAPLHPRNDTFPGEVLLHLAADALEWCGASRSEPLPLEGLRKRFLPEATFRGRQNAKLQYAVLAQRVSAAGPSRTCLMRSPRGRPTTSGSTPCTRRSPTSAPPPAGRAGVPVRQACQDLDEHPGHPAPADSARMSEPSRLDEWARRSISPGTASKAARRTYTDRRLSSSRWWYGGGRVAGAGLSV
jgi:hypothetical protein